MVKEYWNNIINMKRNIIRKNTGLNGISIERQIEIPHKRHTWYWESGVPKLGIRRSQFGNALFPSREYTIPNLGTFVVSLKTLLGMPKNAAGEEARCVFVQQTAWFIQRQGKVLAVTGDVITFAAR